MNYGARQLDESVEVNAGLDRDRDPPPIKVNPSHAHVPLAPRLPPFTRTYYGEARLLVGTSFDAARKICCSSTLISSSPTRRRSHPDPVVHPDDPALSLCQFRSSHPRLLDRPLLGDVSITITRLPTPNPFHYYVLHADDARDQHLSPSQCGIFRHTVPSIRSPHFTSHYYCIPFPVHSPVNSVLAFRSARTHTLRADARSVRPVLSCSRVIISFPILSDVHSYRLRCISCDIHIFLVHSVHVSTLTGRQARRRTRTTLPTPGASTCTSTGRLAVRHALTPGPSPSYSLTHSLGSHSEARSWKSRTRMSASASTTRTTTTTPMMHSDSDSAKICSLFRLRSRISINKTFCSVPSQRRRFHPTAWSHGSIVLFKSFGSIMSRAVEEKEKGG